MVRKRKLTDEDVRVWKQVTEKVTPNLTMPQNLVDPAPLPKPVNRPPKKQPKPNFIPSFSKPKPVQPKPKQAPSFLDAPAKTSPNMDKRNFQRLLKGQMEIDGTLDLHGMTADQAKVRLTQYISQAHRQGLRMLLVITGKGKTRTDEFNRPIHGVLRQSLPDWLRGPALSHLVLQVSSAQQKHGGAGAYYVYLRRKR